ncbi:hypothetical protein CEUSTIGMA_g6851.t1 [Chlamydomonas eustigma]|uniref:MalT-like TPR region domain-containing protein n=1 Tax=Chlamydomonas eustigma TaxID=1157962 RepID=A0A250X9G5_9CHLO|nr:hypothetical protein CEUSTIGMA_g6851.t1 [Chlamydomonas eustigma]|eukprot:GAX79410.1 hypothetical protein CEUSTIGMA_g6851.t1 [Chlamydomonas eustigma]
MFKTLFAMAPAMRDRVTVPVIPPTWRSLTSSSDTVNEFIKYAHRDCKGKMEEATDILRSGISALGTSSGVACARLHLALAQVRMEGSYLSEARSLATKAAFMLLQPDKSSGGLSQEQDRQLRSLLTMQCSKLCVKSLLIEGSDEDACLMAAEAVGTSSGNRAHGLECLSLSLTTSQAAEGAGPHQSRDVLLQRLRTLAESSAAQMMEELPSMPPTPPSTPLPSIISEPSSPSLSTTSATGSSQLAGPQMCLGLWLLSRGSYLAAKEHLQLAACAAKEALAAALSQPAPLISESEWQEVEASSLLGLAQGAMAQEQWGEAEELLGRSLKAAEEVSSDKHPRIALVLMLLGRVYARTARVIFAEGMYRESTKLLQLDSWLSMKQMGRSSSTPPLTAHPSVLAMVAWHFHQLLTVLPNRGGEAARWEECAKELWSKSGAALASHYNIQEVLGDSERLKGSGKDGHGFILSLHIRRAFIVNSKSQSRA